MNSIASNIRAAGTSPESLLLGTALTLLQTHSFDKAAGQFVQVLQRDPKMLRTLAETYLAYWSVPGSSKSPDADQLFPDPTVKDVSASGDTLEDAGDLSSPVAQTTQYAVSPASSPAKASAPTPTPAQRNAALKVAQSVNKSVFETFKLRGEVIGTLSLGELRAMKRTNAAENKLIDKILNHYANAPDDKLVREVVRKADLEKMIADTKGL